MISTSFKLVKSNHTTMKILVVLGTILSLEFSIVSGLVCWQCFNAYGGQEECLKTGQAVKCRDGEEFCEVHIRHLGNKMETPWIEKTCKTSRACLDNVVQNSKPAWSSNGKQLQCNGHSPSSVCRCCCSGDVCNQNQTSCKVVSHCPAINPPKKMKMKCSEKSDVRSVCKFRCKRAFALKGPEQLECNAYGKWSAPTPTCKLITCPKIQKAPKYGFKTCDRGIKIGSKCTFSCQEGYRVYGQSVSQCIDDRDGDEFGVWSIMEPECKPKQCRAHTAMYHGSIKCTNENYVGSTCTFTCNTKEEYHLYPDHAPNALTCQPSEQWNGIKPCCTHSCPPFAVMDFVVVLDSSSSVGAKNWKIMVNFVSSFVGKFAIQDDATHVAVIKYNKRVDRKNRISFKSFPRNKTGLLNAISNLPYDDGQGTNTGRALSFVTSMLKSKKSGNRPLAKDVVLIMTDGESQDPVELRSIILRRTGALIFVVPIGNIHIHQIIEMVGPRNRQNILSGAVDRGFEALDDEFAADIASRLCTQPCYNPLHDHSSHPHEH